ncbi:MAG: NAD(P)-dependent oxidoreductase [Alphaproteobacteria bacterium]|nr:NAD(P)-dependent oxidoreductase [Alphaproteobacteria bacterium]
MATSFTFIGFGEAAQHISRGLKAAGAGPMQTYDILFDRPGDAGERLRKRAAEIGVACRKNHAEAVKGSDIVLSAVTAASSPDAARATAPGMKAGQFYMDINSTSPAVKRANAETLAPSGARFVEAAVMESVPPHGHQVPILLAGSAARELADLLRPLGMRVEAVGDKIGQASSIKMFRSVIIKGMEALMLESLYAAAEMGVTERVLESLAGTYPGMDWPKAVDYLVGRTAQHGARRVAEMREVARTLRDMGHQSLMAEATANRIEWCVKALAGHRFDQGVPKAAEVFAEIDRRKPRRPAA